MTKTHFIELANVIRDNINDFTPNAIERLADYCHSANPAFNRGRWMSYIKRECGPNGGKVKR